MHLVPGTGQSVLMKHWYAVELHRGTCSPEQSLVPFRVVAQTPSGSLRAIPYH